MMRKRAIAMLAGGAVSLVGCAAQNQEWHTGCTVTAKDILVDISGSDGNTSTTRTKRVSTDKCGSFDVSDALSVGQFDSWDLWTKLEVGKKYDIKSGGYRVGFFSMFPTVLEVKDAA